MGSGPRYFDRPKRRRRAVRTPISGGLTPGLRGTPGGSGLNRRQVPPSPARLPVASQQKNGPAKAAERLAPASPEKRLEHLTEPVRRGGIAQVPPHWPRPVARSWRWHSNNLGELARPWSSIPGDSGGCSPQPWLAAEG